MHFILEPALPFLHKSVLVGADGEPKDNSRDAFKIVIAECVGSFHMEDVSENERDLAVAKKNSTEKGSIVEQVRGMFSTIQEKDAQERSWPVLK